VGVVVSGSLGDVNLTLGLNTSPASESLKTFFTTLNEQSKKASNAFKPQETALSTLVKRAQKLGYEYDKVGNSFKDAFGNTVGIQKVQQRIQLLDKSLFNLRKTTKRSVAAIQQGFKDILSGIPQGIGLAIGQSLIQPLQQLPQALAGAATESVAAFTEIDRALRQTLSIAGEDSAAFDELSQFMLELAGSTKFTANELSEASVALARAGYSAEELKAAMPGIAQGAAAAGESLGTMSDVVVATMGGFQLGAEQTEEAVDILTNTANNANTSVAELGDGLKYAAPVAKSLGFNLEETAAAAGLLANSGIKASQMGTALRTGLTRLAGAANGTNSEFAQLSKGTGRMSTVLTKIGADIVDTNGNLKAMPQLLDALRTGFEGFSSTERSLAAKILFGDEAGSAWISLLNTSAEETNSFFTTISNSSGVAAETAQKNLEGFAGSLDLLNSAIGSVQAAFGKFLTGILKPIVDGITTMLNLFNSLPGPIQQGVIAIGALTAAIGAAIISFGIFKALAISGVFKGLAAGFALAAKSAVLLSTTLINKVVASFGVLITKTVALNTAIAATSFSLKTLAITSTGAVINAITAAGAAMGALALKVGLVGKAILTLNFKALVPVLGAIANGFLGAAASAAKFVIAIGPIAWAAAAIGAVAAAVHTWSAVTQEGNAIQSESRDLTKELSEELEGLVPAIENVPWERAVERVGLFQATLDILRESIGLQTAQDAELIDSTNKVADTYEKVNEQLDESISIIGKDVDALSKLTVGTKEYEKELERVNKMQNAVDKNIQKHIRLLQERIDSTMDGRVAMDQLNESERSFVLNLQYAIDNLKEQREELLAMAPAASDLASAMEKGAEAVEDVSKRLKDANSAFDSAKEVFNSAVGAMEEAFSNLQNQLKEGLDVEISGIEEAISDLKRVEQAQAKAYAQEKRDRSQANQAASRAAAARIRNVQRSGAAAAKAAQNELDEFKKANEQIEKEARKRFDAAKEGYEKTQRAQEKSHQRAMKSLDAEIALIQRRADAATASYDGQIEALRELTPAEQKLAQLEKQRLQDAAKGTGEEALKARASLERMERERQIAQIEKDREIQLAAIEAEREAAEQRKREAEEEYQTKREERELSFAEGQKQRELAMEAMKEEHAAAEEERADAIDAKKEATAAKVQQLEDQERARKEAFAAQEFLREEKRRKQKEATAEKIKQKEAEIEEKKKEFKAAEEQREEAFTAKRKDLEREYREAIGETSEYIIDEGDTAWTTYANDAIKQLARVEEAAKRAAAAAAAADDSNVVRQSALASNFAGGPIDAGRLTHINELGQEAFLGESGKLSLINKAPGAVWRAPEAGTIIPASITKGLAIPPKGAVVAQANRTVTNASAAHGTTERNLMRLMGAINSSNDRIVNNVSVEAPNTVQAASDLMVELTKLKRRRLG